MTDREHMRLLLVARLSRKRQRGEGSGILTQDQRGREWAERQGHTIVDVVPDYARGTVPPWDRRNLKPWVTRPDLMARYDGILAYKQDRLSRGEWAQEARIRLWAEQNGKVLVIVDGPQWPPRHEGDKYWWEAQASQAHQELEDIRERTARAVRPLRQQGKLVGRPAWGYVVGGDEGDKGLVPTPEGREYAPQIWQRYADGQSLRQICHWLDAKGVKRPSGSKWSAKTLGDMLRNTTYVGLRRDGQGRIVHRCEGIVDPVLFRRVVKRLDSRPTRRGKFRGETALLTTVLMCGRCGSPMYRGWTGAPGKRRADRYVCHGKDGQPGCGTTVSLEWLDDYVDDAMSANHEEIAEMRLVGGEDHSSERETIRLELRALSAEDLSYDEEDRRRAELRKRLDNVPADSEGAWKMVKTGELWSEKWNAAGWNERRRLLLDKGLRVSFSWSDDDHSHRDPNEYGVVRMGTDISFVMFGDKGHPRAAELLAAVREAVSQGTEPLAAMREVPHGR